jgi:Leu/Phe-tRNA-protein transferase
MNEKDIEFLRLTTDICYIIGGFYGGKGPEENLFPFMQDSGVTVWLDMNRKAIFYPDEITRLQSFALAKLAEDHGLAIDIYDDDSK